MAKANATSRTAAKKTVDLVRHGKTLTSLLTVYERIRTGEIEWNQAMVEALRLSIVVKTKEIDEAVLGEQS